ncbi:MAG TPA: helix-turn-helix transcriptional regulator [Candidatus Tumulicola sp.]|jgi:DNA-binding CsgD family transcriptional regulator
MPDAAEAAIEDLLLAGRWAAALAAAYAWRAGDLRSEPALRRLAAGVFALSGHDRALAATVDPRLLSGGRIDELAGGARSHDYAASASVSAWSGDGDAAFREFGLAHERALAEGRFAFALGALERCAHHAFLFGDLPKARTAIADAGALAIERRSAHWRVRCAAIAARIAADAGEPDVAAGILERERADLLAPEALALFAPTGAHLAVAAGDPAALLVWASQRVLETALHSDVRDAALAAATAQLIALPNEGPPYPALAGALRRALLSAESAAASLELFTLATRCAGVDEAAFALRALDAVPAPHRRSVEAHRQLAQAYAGFRFGERESAVDRASDAARAFDSLGLRRWTNEAMLLLVQRERSPEPAARRRPTALSLTQREQQVAHLIRRGAANREIAHALQISEHTVERHVSSILSRLGLRSRWQIVDGRQPDAKS